MSARIDWSGVAWQAGGPGARFKTVERDGRRIRLLELTPEFVEADWCRRGHAGQLIEGSLELHFPDRTERLSAGDALAIEAGEVQRHKAHALSGRVLLFLVEPL